MNRIAGQDLVDQGLERVTRLRPDLQERCAEGRRMLAAEQIHVAVVVDRRELGAPGHEHRLLGGQHDADERRQRRRPGGDRAEGRGVPIEAPDHVAHDPAATQDGSSVPRHAVPFAVWSRPRDHDIADAGLAVQPA